MQAPPFRLTNTNNNCRADERRHGCRGPSSQRRGRRHGRLGRRHGRRLSARRGAEAAGPWRLKRAARRRWWGPMAGSCVQRSAILMSGSHDVTLPGGAGLRARCRFACAAAEGARAARVYARRGNRGTARVRLWCGGHLRASALFAARRGQRCLGLGQACPPPAPSAASHRMLPCSCRLGAAAGGGRRGRGERPCLAPKKPRHLLVLTKGRVDVTLTHPVVSDWTKKRSPTAGDWLG